MNIRIRYFAALREIIGKSEEIIGFPAGTRVADARAYILVHHAGLQNTLERAVCSVNRRYASAESELHEGDELVFIPPTGGGSQIEPVVQLTSEPLDREALVAAVSHPSVGGIVVFEGVVRDHARGKQVRYLEYEIYEEMAYEQLREIAAEAHKRWGVERVAIAHRSGRLEIGEASVIIVVASPHRAEAFEACRYIIDTLKANVPIWKKEVATDGETWVEG
jgi:molybdopterin synthase catalytic subunit